MLGLYPKGNGYTSKMFETLRREMFLTSITPETDRICRRNTKPRIRINMQGVTQFGPTPAMAAAVYYESSEATTHLAALQRWLGARVTAPGFPWNGAT